MNVPITFDPRVVQFDGIEARPYGGWYRKDLKPGSAWWTRYNDKITHLYMACPCGCGDVFAIPVIGSKAVFKMNGWNWDGNEELPTLTPSIQRIAGCKWHGHLTKGIFTEA